MGTIIRKNFFDLGPGDAAEELIEVLAKREKFRIERIVSRGHTSPPGFWYDQETDEFVLVLSGKGSLVFEGQREPVVLEPGDYVIIPAHVKHRVAWTDPDHDTIWLAVHIQPPY